MHGEIGGSLDERLLDLFDEQPLAADLRERHVEDLVARRLDDRQLDLRAGRDGLDARLDVIRLPECELAAARRDDESIAHCAFRSEDTVSGGVSATASASPASPASPAS